MRLFLLVLIFLALLVNCSPEDSSVKSAIEQDFDRSRTIIHTTVIWHDTQGQVDKVFSESFGDKEPGRTAFAIWPETSDDPWCTIHALRPKAIDDDNMDILGHEMYHCLHGTFHK